MFTFSGLLGRSRYLLAATIRIAIFVTSTLAFPFLLQGLVALSGCRGIGGACGALGLVWSSAYKPLVAVVLVFSFAGISVRRARDAGLYGAVGLIVPLLLALDHQFLTVFGAPWSLGFTMGVLRLPVPAFAIAALVATAALCLAPSRADPSAPRIGGLRPPGKAVVLVSLALALAACLIGLKQDAFALVVNATGILLPTFCIYFALVWAAKDVVRTPSFVGGLLLALATLPFLHWAHAQRTSDQDRAREAASVAAVPTVKPSTIPTTLVFQSSSSSGLRAAWTVPDIERVIAKGSYGSQLREFTRDVGRRTGGPAKIDALPDSYLLLKVGRESSFAQKGETYGLTGGPYELRTVDGGRDDLSAVWYRAFRPGPVSPPILTAAGWYRGSNSATTTEISASIERFLKDALPRSQAAGKSAPARGG